MLKPLTLLLNIVLDFPSDNILIVFSLDFMLANSLLTAWLVIILPVRFASAKTLADVFLSVRIGLPSIIPNVSKKSVFFILFFCWIGKPAPLPVLAILALSVLV